MANVFERVKALTRLIPRGRAVTYGQAAAWMGWHRVLGRAGPHYARVTTSCETHSAELQRQLLEDEGVEFDQHDRIDLTRFGWDGPTWPVLEQIL